MPGDVITLYGTGFGATNPPFRRAPSLLRPHR